MHLASRYVHNNAYTEAELPECFERNSEGLLKNMVRARARGRVRVMVRVRLRVSVRARVSLLKTMARIGEM